MFLMVLTTATTLAVATIFLYHFIEKPQYEESRRAYLSSVEELVKRSFSKALGWEGNKFWNNTNQVALASSELEGNLTNLSVMPPLLRIHVQAGDGTPIYSPPGTKLSQVPPPRDLSSITVRTNRFHAGICETIIPFVRQLDPLFERREQSPVINGLVYLRFDFSPLETRRNAFLFTGCIVLAISFFTGWLISSRLENVVTRPITQLAGTAIQITEVQDYSPRLKHQRNDELGDLIDGFNAMLAQIEQRDAALHQAQEDLEQRVLDRTRELRQEIAERRRTEKDLAQQLARISLLNQITRAVSNRQDLESILSVLLSELTLHLPADFGCALLLEPASQHLRVACCQERELETAYLAWKVEDWAVPLAGSGWEAPDEGPMFLKGLVNEAPRSVFRKPAALGMQTAAALPLRVEEHLIGILMVARRVADGFSPGEQDFLRALSEHVAMAGHHAQLYDQLQKAYDELRQTRMAVMQHERLRALGQMASGVAHDINNALSPVSGFAELLLLTEPQLSENALKYLKYIKTAGDDVAHIVARLREFYRSRQEEQPLLPIGLDKLVREVVEMTRPRWRDLAQRRGIDIAVETDLCSEAGSVVGIEPELREALTNLVFNAVDAMPGGGTLTIRTRSATRLPTSGGQASHVLLEVVDTGVGMDEETRSRCLEPFFSTKGQRGTGLGLAMVYGTMQRHEGGIEIDSAPGKGTTMRLVFPIREAEAAVTADSDSKRPLPQLRILYVDDEPLLRELIREILETAGHSVTTADGGLEGIEAFRELRRQGRPPDVVITDLGMPNIDGRELTALIKREAPETPVVMMTGWGKMMRGQQEIRAPVDALISKPPQIAEIEDTLRRVIRWEHHRKR